MTGDIIWRLKIGVWRVGAFLRPRGPIPNGVRDVDLAGANKLLNHGNKGGRLAILVLTVGRTILGAVYDVAGAVMNFGRPVRMVFRVRIGKVGVARINMATFISWFLPNNGRGVVIALSISWFGKQLTALWLKAGLYTTSTTSRTITALRIWKFCPEANTITGMESTASWNLRKKSANFVPVLVS